MRSKLHNNGSKVVMFPKGTNDDMNSLTANSCEANYTHPEMDV